MNLLKPIASPPLALATLLLAPLLLQVQPSAHAADLTVQVRNLKSGEGKLLVAVFNRAESFPRDMFQGQTVPAQSGSLTLTFKDLPPGAYAVSAYHDVNDNGKLDSNLFGIPNEPYGFSRNARSTMGPPKFADARFEVTNSPVNMAMDLK